MIDIKHFKEKLEEEKALLERELSSIGERNPSNPNDWEAVEKPENLDTADDNVTADNIEEYEGNTAILKQEEIQYNDVLLALKKIEDGTYGKCEVGGEDIPLARLEANASAKTCIEHSK